MRRAAGRGPGRGRPPEASSALFFWGENVTKVTDLQTPKLLLGICTGHAKTLALGVAGPRVPATCDPRSSRTTVIIALKPWVIDLRWPPSCLSGLSGGGSSPEPPPALPVRPSSRLRPTPGDTDLALRLYGLGF